MFITHLTLIFIVPPYNILYKIRFKLFLRLKSITIIFELKCLPTDTYHIIIICTKLNSHLTHTYYIQYYYARMAYYIIIIHPNIMILYCVDLIYILECSSIDTPRLLIIYNMLFNVNIKRLGVLKLSSNRLERTPHIFPYILLICTIGKTIVYRMFIDYIQGVPFTRHKTNIYIHEN